MTREEQIIEASQLYARAQQKPFMDGAMWADKHPTEEVQRLKRMFESDPDAYAQGYKDAIDKVHKWINEKWDVAYTHPLVMDAVHKELDEFMEEQQ